MRPATYSLAVANVDWRETGATPAQPTLTIQSTDSSGQLNEQLRKPDSTLLDAAEIDVTFRFQSLGSDADTQGVLAVSNNVTGDFVLELATDIGPIQDVLQATRRYADATGDDITYMLRLCAADDVIVTCEKHVFLIYGSGGTLLRRRSLIPNGVEV